MPACAHALRSCPHQVNPSFGVRRVFVRSITNDDYASQNVVRAGSPQETSAGFAIDICADAVMRNDLHVICKRLISCRFCLDEEVGIAAHLMRL